MAACDLADQALGYQPDSPEPEWWQEWIQIQLNRMWVYYYHLGRPEEMARLGEQIRPALEQYGTPGQRCLFYMRLVLMALLQDRFVTSDKTLAHAQLMISASRDVDNLSDVGLAQFVWGFSHLWRGELDEAEAGLLQSLATAERIGDVTLQARALVYLTLVKRKRGHLNETGELALRTLAVAKAGQMLEYIALSQTHLAWIAWRQKDLAAAQQIAQAALEDLRKASQASPLCWHALWPLLGVALEHNHYANAVDYARQMLDPSQQRLPSDIAVCLERAVSAWEGSDNAEAQRQFERAASAAAATGYL